MNAAHGRHDATKPAAARREPHADVRETELAHDHLGVGARQMENLSGGEAWLHDLSDACQEQPDADSPEDEPAK